MALSPDRFVTLRGGFAIPVEPYLLVLKLDAAGFRFKLDDDGGLLIAPRRKLSPEDLAAITRWAVEIRVLISFEAEDSHITN